MTAYFLTDRVLGTGRGEFAEFDLLSHIDGSSKAFVTSRRPCSPEITLSYERVIGCVLFIGRLLCDPKCSVC
jgi:hypothetical protein